MQVTPLRFVFLQLLYLFNFGSSSVYLRKLALGLPLFRCPADYNSAIVQWHLMLVCDVFIQSNLTRSVEFALFCFLVLFFLKVLISNFGGPQDVEH